MLKCLKFSLNNFSDIFQFLIEFFDSLRVPKLEYMNSLSRLEYLDTDAILLTFVISE